MEPIKNCPICTKPLKKVKNEYICPDCGYKLLVSKAVRAYPDSSAGSTDSTAVNSTNPDNNNSRNLSGGNISKSDKHLLKSLKVFILVFIGVILATVAITAVNAALVRNKNNNSSYNNRHGSSSSAEATAGSETEPRDRFDNMVNNANTVMTRPRTAAVTELCEIIFEKPIDSISLDELASVTLLDFYMMNDTALAAYFELSDSTSATCVLPYDDIDTSDLNCFTGLETLLLENMTLDYNTDWSGLTKLSILQVDSDLDEIAKVMDPSQLIYLEIGNIFSADFSSIAEFDNLSYLYVDMHYYNSLDGLSDAPSLTTLCLKNADSITDFSELSKMPYLNSLSIDGKNLKDISFISDYYELNELELKNTSVKNIDAIADCADTLVSLKLHRNTAVAPSDYDVITECTNLQTLELYPEYNFDAIMEVPNLSGLTQLTSLTLGNYDYFTNIGDVSGVTELSLSLASYMADDEVLSLFPNLEALTLDDMSVTPEFFAPLSSMEQLTSLDMNGTYLWGDISAILAAPSLTRLYLTDSTIGINAGISTASDSLLILDLTDTRFYLLNDDGSYNYGGTTMLSLGENTYFLEGFPNLAILYVPGHELYDLDFTANMPSLFYLDISDNNISDLSALTELTGLELLICTDNPVKNTDGLDDVIIIN